MRSIELRDAHREDVHLGTEAVDCIDRTFHPRASERVLAGHHPHPPPLADFSKGGNPAKTVRRRHR
jgi:hypothetical protein